MYGDPRGSFGSFLKYMAYPTLLNYSDNGALNGKEPGANERIVSIRISPDEILNYFFSQTCKFDLLDSHSVQNLRI